MFINVRRAMSCNTRDVRYTYSNRSYYMIMMYRYWICITNRSLICRLVNAMYLDIVIRTSLLELSNNCFPIVHCYISSYNNVWCSYYDYCFIGCCYELGWYLKILYTIEIYSSLMNITMILWSVAVGRGNLERKLELSFIEFLPPSRIKTKTCNWYTQTAYS